MAHHGMNALEGLHAFCHYAHRAQRGDRFGRLFPLPPLYVRPAALHAFGAQDGPMDAGENANRTSTVDVGQVFFGQFIDHDITLDVTSSLTSVNVADATPNVRTPTLDLDAIYGSGPEASPFLYHGTGPFRSVKLITGADGTAAPGQSAALAAEDLSRTVHGTALIGDPRNDENRIISQLHLGMLRFHNAIVDHLHAEDPDLEGHELFEEAQRLTRWHYQWVVIEDFLVAMCGRAVVADILGTGRRFYCPTPDIPFIPVEFSVAAYRFGHAMIPQRIQVQQGDAAFEVFGSTLGRGFAPLSDARAVVDWHELVETGAGRQVQKAEKMGPHMAHDLLDLPFIASGVSSLATRNLLRGQSFQLPSGEQVAQHMERPQSEIDSVTAAVRTRMTANPHSAPHADALDTGTPLWVYLLTEAAEVGRETAPGSFDKEEGLGPVGARIVAETIIGLVELDPRSYLASNRGWNPEADGVGVHTLGDMMTYTP